MKTKIFTLLAAALFVSTIGYGQIIKNDGATIVVQNGATLFVEGGGVVSIENTAGGTIDNNGTIEVQGDFLNNGTYDGTDAHTLRFSGAQSANYTGNGAILSAVEMAKTGGATVSLQDAMTVRNSLTFSEDDNRLVLGASNLTMQTGATLTGHDANHFVVTDGAGAMTREALGVGNHAFPVGFEATTYNPANLNVTAGSDDFTVRAYGTPTDMDGETGTAFTEDVIDAAWAIDDNAGGATTDVILQWRTADELTNFNRDASAVGKNDGLGWDLLAADTSAATNLGGGVWSQTRTGVTSFSNFSVGGQPLAQKLNLTLDVWLQGPYNGATMNDDLVSTQLASFPLTEPYSALGYTMKGFGGGETTDAPTLTSNNVVDWIDIELRDGGDNSNIVGTKNALLLDNGMVANPDGTVPVTIEGVAPGNYYVVVKHKNSLAAMSLNPIDFNSGSAIFSFKGNVDVFGGAGAQADLTGGQFGLFHSDLDGSGVVDAGDRSQAWNDRNLSGYERSDSNLSGTVDASDRSNAWNNRNKSTAVPAGN